MVNRNKRAVTVSLCEDVLLNILLRLPKRDVLKCKCVSNEWRRIITHVFVPLLAAEAPFSGIYFRLVQIKDKPFLLKHCSQTVIDQYHHLVAYDGSIHSIRSASLKPHVITYWHRKRPCHPDMGLGSLLPFDHIGPDFLDSCNGLVLFVQRPKPQFFVCNPAIQQCVPLPLPPPSAHISSLYASLAFEPSESNEYRVVISTLSTHPQCLHVFYSQSGEWKTHEVQIEFPTSAKAFKLVRHSIYLKHALYRLSMFSKILCFDLKSMTARVINCPGQRSPCTQPKDAPPPGCIGVSNGAITYATDEDGYVCVWLLGEPEEPSYWTLKYKISYEHLWNSTAGSGKKSVSPRANMGWIRCCGIHPTSNSLFFCSSFQVFKYDINKDCIEMVRELDKYFDMMCSFFFPIFLHKSVFVTLKNWCKGLTANIDDYEDIQDRWCYIEQ